MSLASSGDFSKVHMCLSDLLDSYTGTTCAEDQPGKDGIVMQFVKGMDKNNGTAIILLKLNLVGYLLNHSSNVLSIVMIVHIGFTTRRVQKRLTYIKQNYCALYKGQSIFNTK